MTSKLEYILVTKLQMEVLYVLQTRTTLDELIAVTGKSDKYLRIILSQLVAKGLVTKSPPVKATWAATTRVGVEEAE